MFFRKKDLQEKTVFSDESDNAPVAGADKFLEVEYSSLRFEQRNRYDYANRLNSGFITFTTAVFTIGISLLVLDNNIVSNYSPTNNVAPETVAGGLLLIEFFTSILFMLPILYSKICFNHSIENSVRISLITDYLNCAVSRSHKHNWDNARREGGVLPYYFGSFGAAASAKRVGDLSNMHRIISWLCFTVGLINGFSTYYNCVYCYPIGVGSTKNTIWIVVGTWYIIIILGSSLISVGRKGQKT